MSEVPITDDPGMAQFAYVEGKWHRVKFVGDGKKTIKCGVDYPAFEGPEKRQAGGTHICVHMNTPICFDCFSELEKICVWD